MFNVAEKDVGVNGGQVILLMNIELEILFAFATDRLLYPFGLSKF